MAVPKQQPVNNPALKKALEVLKQENTPQKMNAVINELVRATLLAPVVLSLNGGAMPKPDAEGKVTLPKDTKVSFTMLTSKDGKKYYMAFTDAEALKKWQRKPGVHQTVLLRFDDYAAMMAKTPEASGIIINPFGEGLRMEAPMVAAIKKQRDEMLARAKAAQQNQIKAGDKVTLLEPTVLADELLDPICAVLKNYDSIAAAYLQVMIVNDTRKSYLVILDGPKDEKLFAAIAQAARAYLTAGDKKMDLSITVSASPLGQQGMNGSEPFYRKGEGRIYEEDDE